MTSPYDAPPAEPPPPSLGIRIWERLPEAALLIWMFLLGCVPLYNFDIWMHLRTGQLILEQGKLPVVDWYTYMDWDKPWIELHWLFQILAAGVFWLGGVSLLVVAKALCLMLAVGIAWHSSDDGLPSWAKALCWVLPVVCISERAVVKPEILSLVFLALWLWIVRRADRKRGLLFCLPVLQAIWINCHGLFVLGLVIGAAWFGDVLFRQFARGRFGLEPPGNVSLRVLTATCLASAVASLANPYFEEGALFPFKLLEEMSDEELVRIDEHERPIVFVRRHGYKATYQMAEGALWLLTLGSFLWLARERRVNVFRLLLFAAFSFLAWEAVRNINVFALLCGYILSANCGDALRLSRERRGLVEQEPGRSSRLCHQLTVALLAGLMLLVVTNAWASVFGKFARFGFGQARAQFAHNAAIFAGLPGMPRRAYVSHYGQAAVYIFHNAPDRYVFMDGRLEVVTPDTEKRFHAAYLLMTRKDRRFETLLRNGEGEMPAVILDTRQSREAINALLFTPGWRLVYADEAGAVFLKNSIADQLRLPFADPTPLKDFPPDW